MLSPALNFRGGVSCCRAIRSCCSLRLLRKDRTVVLDVRRGSFEEITFIYVSCSPLDGTAILPAKSDQQSNQVRSSIGCTDRDDHKRSAAAVLVQERSSSIVGRFQLQ